MLSDMDLLDEPDIPQLPDWILDLDQRAEHRTTEHDGCAIQWRIWGEGPPLALLHGGHGSWRHWVRNIDTLAQHYRVMAVDLPSFGDSAIYMTEDLHDYARIVAQGATDLAGTDTPMRTAGFSFGSVIGSLMLKHFDQGVARHVMLGSPILGRTHPVTDRLKKWKGMPIPEHRAAAHANNVGELMLTGPDSVTDEATAIQMSHAEQARGMYRGLFRKLDVPADIAAWDGELTVIYGDRDAITCQHLDERRAKVAEIKPDAEFHVIPDTGHWVQYQAADAVHEIMLRRLA